MLLLKRYVHSNIDPVLSLRNLEYNREYEVRRVVKVCLLTNFPGYFKSPPY